MTGPRDLARRRSLAVAAVKAAGLVFMAFVLAYSGNMIDNAGPDGTGPGAHHGWTRLLLLLTLIFLVTAVVILGRAVVASVGQWRSRKLMSPGDD